MWVVVSGTWDLNFVPKPSYEESRTWRVEAEPVEAAQLKHWIFRVQRVLVLPDKLLAKDTKADRAEGVRRQGGPGDPCPLTTQVSCPTSCLLLLSPSLIASPGMGMMGG